MALLSKLQGCDLSPLIYLFCPL